MSKGNLELLSVNVKLFAWVREIIGKEEIRLRLQHNATVGDLRKKIVDLYPALSSIRIPIMVALNHRIVDDSTILSHMDETALLPPVGGG